MPPAPAPPAPAPPAPDAPATDARPTIRFHRLIRSARPPQPATRDAAGTIPIRAARYCEALTTACAYGWFVFAPLDLRLYWDGTDIHWSCPALPDWMVLDDAAQFPNFSQEFDATAPDFAQGFSPPLLTRLPEPGMLQVWTGLIAQTTPGWSLNVRPPVNLTTATGYAAFEGIVETDLWFGPLFANLRLTRTHSPVQLRTDLPLLQVQPLPKTATTTPTATVTDGLDNTTWPLFTRDVIAPNQDPTRPPGRYATTIRRARACAAAG